MSSMSVGAETVGRDTLSVDHDDIDINLESTPKVEVGIEDTQITNPIADFLKKHGHKYTTDHDGELITYNEAVEKCVSLRNLIIVMGDAVLLITTAIHSPENSDNNELTESRDKSFDSLEGLLETEEREGGKGDSTAKLSTDSPQATESTTAKTSDSITNTRKEVTESQSTNADTSVNSSANTSSGGGALHNEAQPHNQESQRADIYDSPIKDRHRRENEKSDTQHNNTSVSGQIIESGQSQPLARGQNSVDVIRGSLSQKEQSATAQHRTRPLKAQAPGATSHKTALSTESAQSSESNQIHSNRDPISKQGVDSNLSLTADKDSVKGHKSDVHIKEKGLGGATHNKVGNVKEVQNQTHAVAALNEAKNNKDADNANRVPISSLDKKLDTKERQAKTKEVIDTDNIEAIPPSAEVIEHTIHEVARNIEDMGDKDREEAHEILNNIAVKIQELQTIISPVDEKAARDEESTASDQMGPSEIDQTRKINILESEIKHLFKQLLDYTEADSTPQFVNSLSHLAIDIARFEKTLEHQLEESSNLPTQSGTHEVINGLLKATSQLKKSVVHACYIGQSALKLCTAQSIPDRIT